MYCIMNDYSKAPASSNVVVAKSNDLVNAVCRLSLLESQLLRFCMAWSREHKKGFSTDTPLRLHVSDFAEKFGLGQGTAYQQAKEALEGLYKRDLTIYVTDAETGKEEVIRTRWLTRYSYIDGAGIITVIFSIDVIQHITRLEKAFTSYPLEDITQFSSFYAVKLYELLMQFKDKGWRTISIEDLRLVFCIRPTQYKFVAEFKRNTVDVAVAQINELTNWKVRYEQNKHGRNIVSLTFNIKPKSKRPDIPKPPTPDDAYIGRHARPGESWEAARKRLVADCKAGINHDQNDLLK